MRHSCWPSIDRACGKRLTFLLGVRQPAAELFRSLLRNNSARLHGSRAAKFNAAAGGSRPYDCSATANR